MSDIQSLIKMLQSDNPNKRYDACEELRVARHPLPQDAIDALHTATKDSNPEVADAAQRAIALHTPQLTPDVMDEQEKDKTTTVTTSRDLIIGFLGWFLVGNLVLWFEFEANWDLTALYFGVPSVTVIAIGTLFYKKMNWFAYGILVAVITNTLLWIGISGEVHVLLLLIGASVPLPLGLLMIFVQ